MKLSFDLRKAIVDEFDYVAKKVSEEEDLSRKNYFFSATYAVVNRVLNLEFNPSLVLLHDVLQSTYKTIDSRLTSLASRQERVMSIPEELFDSLAKAVKDLGSAIRDDEDFSQPLQKIAIIGYATTGNGYYLYKKGILKL